MKYLLFAGEDHHIRSYGLGIGNLVGQYDSIERCQEQFNYFIKDQTQPSWWGLIAECSGLGLFPVQAFPFIEWKRPEGESVVRPFYCFVWYDAKHQG